MPVGAPSTVCSTCWTAAALKNPLPDQSRRQLLFMLGQLDGVTGLGPRVRS
jgi:hypothetical protein